MGVRVDNVLNMAAGVIETITDNKVQKTQKVFAAFLDNAAKSSNITLDNANNYVAANDSNTVSAGNTGDSSPDGSEAKQNVKDNTYSASKTEKTDQKTVKTDNKQTQDAETVSSDLETNVVAEEEIMLVENIENAIKSMLAQELGITIEELETTLDAMGISAVDLLDSKTLMDFTMQINGVDDISVILTDENLMSQYKELTEEINFTVESVLKENDVPIEQLPQIIEDVKTFVEQDVNFGEVNVGANVNHDVGVNVNAEQPEIISNNLPNDIVVSEDGNIVATEKTNDTVVEVQAQPVQENQTVQKTVAAEETVQTQEIEKNYELQETVQTQEVYKTNKTDTQDTNEVLQANEDDTEESSDIIAKPIELSEENDDNSSEQNLGNSSNNEHRDNGNSLLQQRKETVRSDFAVGVQQQSQLVNTVVDGIANAQLSYSAADMEEIVNQIVERIKVEVNSNTTSMEMQLNPESYGKVQLHVALKDGMVTAQMTVENEAVRRAVETQIVQLRENMNSQGLKVEAIEVTIASHEFERNLQQESNANQQAFEEQQQKAASKRMNLNLNMEDWDAEDTQELSDAEALERKIMLESGNRMSIQA